jgi:hypothetical protein
MPPSANGKADGVQILKGSDIPSQYVDSGKHYLTTRKIETLEAVAALKDMPDMVAKRADGIIANLPVNGRIEAAELVRMESAQIFPTLFPEEQQALPALWALLEAPNPTASTIAVPVDDLTVAEQLTQPSGLTYPASLLISSLPGDLQTVSKRVQLVFNGDANALTIQIADIDKVLADPQAFTPAEVTQLNTVKKIFAERATSSSEAKAKVPTPGHSSKTTTFGQMSLELTSDIALKERRQIYYDNLSLWGVTMTLEQTLGATLHAPANAKLILLQLDTGEEIIYSGADVVFGEHPVGNVVLERYDMGARKETHSIALPAFKPGVHSTGLNNVIDCKLVTANNTPLLKNAVAYSTANHYQFLDSVFAPTMNVNASIPQSTIDNLATQKSSLPSGRYELQTQVGLLAVDLYPEGVVMVHLNAQTAKLYPGSSGPLRMLTAPVSNVSVRFVPSANQITVGNQTFTLDVTQRTK